MVNKAWCPHKGYKNLNKPAPENRVETYKRLSKASLEAFYV